MQNSEDFRLLIFAIGTKHGREPLSCFLQSDSGKNKTLRGPSGLTRNHTSLLGLGADQELGYSSSRTKSCDLVCARFCA